MKLRLNREQIKKAADTSSNLSILFFGAMIAPFVGQVDSADFTVVVSGGVLAIAFFLQSMLILKGVRNEFKY